MEGWRKVHNEELYSCTFDSSSNTLE